MSSKQHKPGYKHTHLGWIPQEWEVHEVGQVVDIFVGRDLKEDCYSDIQDTIYKYPVYSNTVENEGLYGYYNFQEYTGESLTVIGRGAGLGTTFTRTGAFGAIGRLIVLFPKENYKAHYITEYFNGKIRLFTESSGIPQLTGEAISRYKIAFPPCWEQVKISAILSTWDEAIQKTQQLIEQLKQRNKGLLNSLLTPKKNWTEIRIGSLIKEVKNPVEWDDTELYHLISVRRRSGGVFFRESLYGSQILTKNLSTVHEGDFLFSKMQIVHGASALVTEKSDSMKVSGSYIIARAKDTTKLDMQFFNWLSKTKWFYRISYISSYGVHIEKMTFDFTDFQKHKVLIPSTVEEQQQIVEVLEKADYEVKLYERQHATLQQQKKGLMQKLLSGEVRVKNLN